MTIDRFIIVARQPGNDKYHIVEHMIPGIVYRTLCCDDIEGSNVLVTMAYNFRKESICDKCMSYYTDIRIESL